MKRKIVTRKEDIETLIEIIENREDYKENSKNGLVILLNGEWGTGKTTFLNEFIEKMNGKENIELFSNYNAYENGQSYAHMAFKFKWFLFKQK